MDSHFLFKLVDKYLDGTATPDERKLVEGYYDQLSKGDLAGLSEEKRASLKNTIHQGIRASIPVAPVKIIGTRRRFARIAAAAAILILLGTGSYFLFFNEAKKTNLASLSQTERFKNDINPANEGVVLKTDNGREIFLDSINNGKLVTDGQLAIQKTDGGLAYTLQDEQVYYHTISTNKGKDYHLTLADGTGVWLDALSSIHFPTSFPGSERVVEVTGQAYFEVAKDPSKPFKVKTGGQVVEVLGTHFNINAHDADIKTTLLEGSVKIQSATGNGQSAILKPGDQIILGSNLQFQTTTNPDLEQVMAWKDGKFWFDGATMEEIMKQVSRWYDIEVVYQGKIAEEFVAKIPRNTPVSRLLSLLEMTKQVAFTIEGNKVTVISLPNKIR